MMISFGRHDFWTPRPKPENPPAFHPRYRYGEWPEGYVFPDIYWYPDKLRIRVATVIKTAKALGIIKSSPCQMCGRAEKIEAHHESYMFPLLIAWLCSECHLYIHQYKRYDRDHTSRTHPHVGVMLMELLPNVLKPDLYFPCIHGFKYGERKKALEAEIQNQGT